MNYQQVHPEIIAIRLVFVNCSDAFNRFQSQPQVKANEVTNDCTTILPMPFFAMFAKCGWILMKPSSELFESS